MQSSFQHHSRCAQDFFSPPSDQALNPSKPKQQWECQAGSEVCSQAILWIRTGMQTSSLRLEGFGVVFFSLFFSLFTNTDLKLIRGRENEWVGLTSSLPGAEFHEFIPACRKEPFAPSLCSRCAWRWSIQELPSAARNNCI